ncbi:MAG: NADH-quinone oxidoreductase subunit L [Acidimicrobiia bacterium]
MWFLEHAWLIAVIPAVAFGLIILIGKRLPMQGSELGVLSMLASLVLSVGAAWQWIDRVTGAEGGHSASRALASLGRSFVAAEGGEGAGYVAPVIKRFVWWQSGDVQFTYGSHIDGLAVTLLVVVAFISTLVQIYSLEYLRGDRRYTHYFAALTLFSAGMLGMVSSENMVQFLLGWEIMGLCSFLLIGHWWEEAANSRAALKAFFTVRVGDVGLLVGIAIVYFASNGWIHDNLGESGFSIAGINAWALSGTATTAALTAAAVAMFIAAIGKSGQFPLHTWLPDAMAGPTPVSSLLHSSTMVVAGVFLVARLYPVFFEGLNILGSNVNLVAVIGGITILIAAALAFVQTDIKKVLAYSTVSQLGYMMMGLGVGAWTPAVFHIFTHAFFKACLFLCAGSVSHSGSHHSFEMKQDMGGLAKKMPITTATWIVSSMALCGVPFFSGFFSKDEIIDNAHHNGYTVFWIIGLVGAFMTTAYMTRATYLTFFGKARGAAAGEHVDEHVAHHDIAHEDVLEAEQSHDAHGHGAQHGPHESPWLITAPLVILATLAIFSGYLNAPAAPFKTEYFTEWVEPASVAVTSDEFALATTSGGFDAAVLPAAEAGGADAEAAGATEGAAAEGESHAAGCGFAHPAEGTVCAFPAVSHAEFKWVNALPSILLVALGFVSSLVICVGIYSKERFALKGLTRRNKAANAGYQFLWNKYYLDHLYEKVIVSGLVGPIAKGAYWVNQHVIDGVVNGAGIGGKLVGRFVYRNIDQRVVDGVVDGSGAAAQGGGRALQPVQSGKVNQYGALLFAGAAIGALVLVIVNS